MTHANLRNKIEQLLSCSAIKIGGDCPWDLQVHNDDFYARVLAEGSLGLGESYMDGWWDCSGLDEFFQRILEARLHTQVKTRKACFDVLKSKLINLQKPSRTFQIGKRHYDIGNNLYRYMLDKLLIYSCGYWENASTLDEAQETPEMARIYSNLGWIAVRQGNAKRDADLRRGTKRIAWEAVRLIEIP